MPEYFHPSRSIKKSGLKEETKCFFISGTRSKITYKIYDVNVLQNDSHPKYRFYDKRLMPR